MNLRMKKEVLIAVLVGLTMGLVITYGFYRVKTSVTTPKITEKIEPVSPTDTTTASRLSISSPDDGTIQAQNTVTVSGTTVPDTFVILFINETQLITTTDATGAFSAEAQLKDGANIISITVADNDGETFSEQRTVIVSDILETLAADPLTSTDSAKASPSASPKISPKPSTNPKL